jgi:hypothetical protein
MNVQEAVAKKLTQIERREQDKIARLAALKAQEEAACEEFRQAMRERIELEYGLEFAGGEVFGWQVQRTQRDDVNGAVFTFEMDLEVGVVRLMLPASLKHVGPPGDQLRWEAARKESIYRDCGTDLIAALTLALTGRY